jgi:hypothetical protein
MRDVVDDDLLCNKSGLGEAAGEGSESIRVIMFLQSFGANAWEALRILLLRRGACVN